MWYVIPFVILLLIAILLKKRENQQNVKKKKTEKSKKNNSKRTHSTSSQRSSRPINPLAQSYAIQEEPILKADPLSEELKANIETLIQSENYMTAEARINQALNQNSRQHELYSYLIDIHILQKDEFALKQLSSYLSSIQLDHLANEADDRFLATQLAEQQKDSEEFASTHFITEIPNAEPSDEFDPLIQAQKQTIQARESQNPDVSDQDAEQEQPKESYPPQSSTFVFETEQYPHPLQVKEKVEEIEDEYVSAEPTAHFMFSSEFEELAEKSQQTQDDEFNPNFDNLSEKSYSNGDQNPEKDEHLELDFVIEESTPSTSVEPTAPPEEFKIELQPLDFDTDSLSLESTANYTTQKTAEKSEEQAPLEFDFDIADFKNNKTSSEISSDQLTEKDIEPEIETSSTEQEHHQALEFSFDLKLDSDQKKSISTDIAEYDDHLDRISEKEHDIKPLDFSFDDALLESSPNLKNEIESSDQIKDLEFDLSDELIFEPELESSQPNEFTHHNEMFNEQADPKISALDYENDPIVLKFPEVLTIDEVELNLELAEQYINFGAFDEAKKLLSEFDQQYTAEQKDIVAKLLQKIDS